MGNRAELENSLVDEIHYLPIEAIETLLKLARLIKDNPSKPPELTGQADNFVEFIRNSPLMDVDIDLTRDPSLCRDRVL
ncbi:MAG: hypothetical protein PHU14_08985 [Methylovulum sp.]|nr:hypothetical protein [Methylovulum sp.]